MYNWQFFYNLIYNLDLVKLEILKTYIKNNLVNNFINFSRFFTRAFIFFDQELDENLRLYIDYQSLNNQTIKNKYHLSLVKKLLNWFSQA